MRDQNEEDYDCDDEYDDESEKEHCLALVESLKFFIEPCEKGFAAIDELGDLVKQGKYKEFLDIVSSIKTMLDEEILIIDSLKLLNQKN
jgi:hypothetical protein